MSKQSAVERGKAATIETTRGRLEFVPVASSPSVFEVFDACGSRVGIIRRTGEGWRTAAKHPSGWIWRTFATHTEAAVAAFDLRAARGA